MPWPEGYSCDFSESKFNLAQVPHVKSYRGFIFGTLNLDAPSLETYLGGVRAPLDEWLDRHPGGTVAFCDANRLKFNGNWKLLYDNSCDGYHVIFSHRSLLAMENRQKVGADAMALQSFAVPFEFLYRDPRSAQTKMVDVCRHQYYCHCCDWIQRYCLAEL